MTTTETGSVSEVTSRVGALRKMSDTVGRHDTDSVLIEPLLHSLGWDTTDPSQVSRGYRVSPTAVPADFALMIGGKPRGLIWTRPLGEGPGDDEWQNRCVQTASEQDVDVIALTDGNDWRFINPFDMSIQDFTLGRKRADSILKGLSPIGYDQLQSGEGNPARQPVQRGKAALVQAMTESEEKVVRLLRQADPNLSAADARLSIARMRSELGGGVAMPQDRPKRRSASKSRRSGSRGQGAPGQTRKRHTLQPEELFQMGMLEGNTQLFASYRGQTLKATLRPDGTVKVGGEEFETLSAAGRAAKRAAHEGNPKSTLSTDGWLFWKVKGEGDELVPLASIRDDAESKKGELVNA